MHLLEEYKKKKNNGADNMMDQMIGDDAQYQSQMLDYLQKNTKED